MPFIYYPPVGGVPLKLREPYYVQLRPDGMGLVPGVLQAGSRPPVGNWVEVRALSKIFRDRYFVQRTDYGTLVPGSLMVGDELPGRMWEELKVTVPKGSIHRFVLEGEDPYVVDNDNADGFTTAAEFLAEKVEPIARLVYPDYPDDAVANPVELLLYSFSGSFEDFDGDLDSLRAFGFSHMWLAPFHGGTLFTNGAIQEWSLAMNGGRGIGYYSIVYAIMEPNQVTVAAYVFLDSIVNKIETLPG